MPKIQANAEKELKDHGWTPKNEPQKYKSGSIWQKGGRVICVPDPIDGKYSDKVWADFVRKQRINQ